jgi:transposase InsO family protein
VEIIIRATSSEVIIRRLQKIFATHGLPEQVTSDNGSNLVSREFEDFFSSHGIYHRKVTPYWPQANATVERFNRTVEKAIRTAHVEERDWRKALDTFLLNYRATPHAMTGVSPAKIMFGREIRTKVPEISKSEQSETLDSALAALLVTRETKRKCSSTVITRIDPLLQLSQKGIWCYSNSLRAISCQHPLIPMVIAWLNGMDVVFFCSEESSRLSL